AVRKIDKATWRIDARSAERVRVRYRVYAYELTVRTAHFDDTHAFWNGACVFLYAEPLRTKPHRVTVVAKEGWRATTALDPNHEEPNVFLARDYDELVDSPFEVGPDELVEFMAHGRPHRIAIWGRVPTPRDTLTADVTTILNGAAAVFGQEV